MWNRPALKFYAKEQLRQYYWKAFLVCLVGGLLGGSAFSGTSSARTTYNYSENGFSHQYNYDLFHYSAGWGAFVFSIAIAVILIAVAFTVFISAPISVGVCSFFTGAPWGNRDFTMLFSAFRNGRYLSIVKTMFFTNLYIFLWSLLFIIPGIIKSYEYRMVPYLINENPQLSHQEAMYYSKLMTDNSKMDIFILDLSFIGWWMLGALAFGVGTLFVVPYVQATEAQLYFALRQRVNIPGPGPGSWQG